MRYMKGKTMLTISHLTKDYGDLLALNDVSMTVAAGERVALLGHNGAGKSTLMKIILGLIPLTGGAVDVMGAAPGSDIARGQVAYLPENVAFHPALTGAEMIGYFLDLRQEPRAQTKVLLERVGLGAAGDRRIGTYSKGMRQRVGLAQALIGHPKLLVLDEPTSGLDPISRRDFYALLDDIAGQGAAILLSSHALTEVEARTDRIAILSKGRMVAQGTLGDLRAQAGLPVVMRITPKTGAQAALQAALPTAEWAGAALCLRFEAQDKLAQLARVTQLGDLIADVDLAPPSLDDIYSHLSRRDAA